MPFVTNCTKESNKNFWTQTAFNENLRLILMANLAKSWLLRPKKILHIM